MLLGRWQSSDLADKDNFNRLKLLLQKTATFVSTFKGEPDAVWVLIPLRHLVSEILYTMAFYLLPAPVRATQPKFLLDTSDENGSTAEEDNLNEGRGISSNVSATETQSPEKWTIEPTQPTQDPIVKGSEIPFHIVSNSTGWSCLTPLTLLQ
jgi:hypothetical protein